MTSGWKPSDPRVQVSGVLNPSAFLCVPNEVYSNEVMSVLWLCAFPHSSPVFVAFQLPYPSLQRPSEQQSQLARVILFLFQGFRGEGASSAQTAIGISLISQISTEPPSRLTAAAHCWYPVDVDFLTVNLESSVHRFDLKTAGTKLLIWRIKGKIWSHYNFVFHVNSGNAYLLFLSSLLRALWFWY